MDFGCYGVCCQNGTDLLGAMPTVKKQDSVRKHEEHLRQCYTVSAPVSNEESVRPLSNDQAQH